MDRCNSRVATIFWQSNKTVNGTRASLYVREVGLCISVSLGP